MHYHLSIRQFLLAVMLLAGPALLAAATWPNLVNYQGQLTDASGNAVTDGNYNVKFAIYPAATPGPTPVWTETQTVTVSKGLFNAVLGSTTGPGLSTLTPAQLNGDLWLGISVGADPEMSPRQQLLGPINANNAEYLDGLLPNNTANNLVVLDASGKIQAGLIQGGSIQFPLAMSGSSTYGLSVINGSGSSTAVGLSVVAASGIESFATDAAGSGLVGSTNGTTGYGVLGLSTGNSSTLTAGVEGQGYIGVQGQTTISGGRGVEGDVPANVSGVAGVVGINNNFNGTGVVGSHKGAGTGMGVRGQSAGGLGAIGVYGVVSGTGGALPSTAVQGYSSQTDAYAVVGLQGYSTGAPYPYAGVYGHTADKGLGIGVLGEGSQAVLANSNGICGICANNTNDAFGTGLSATSPLTALLGSSTTTDKVGLGVNASVASTLPGSAAGQFHASGASGQTYGLNVENDSGSGTGIQTVGGIQAVSAQSVGGGTNFYSDASQKPAFGFWHSDGAPPNFGVGVYATENCGSCFGGVFINTAATNSTLNGVTLPGAALSVVGRLNVGQAGQLNGPAGTFGFPTTPNPYLWNNSYITASSLIFLTPTLAGSPVAAVTNVVDGTATISFTPSLSVATPYQYLIIGQ